MQSNSSNLNHPEGYANLHKAPAGGVDEKQWYIAEVRTGRERICRDQLLLNHYEAYVASRVEEHVYASRNRRKIEKILIPSKLFLHISDKDRIDVLRLCSPSIYKFMTDKAHSIGSNGMHPYATVPDEQMRQMQFMLGYAEKPVSFSTSSLCEGDPIRVVRGPLSGLEGSFLHSNGNTYVAVRIALLGYTLTEIPESDIIPIQ